MIYAFISVKGGVGKTALAVAAAVGLARKPGRRVVYIDADFAGTSLADSIALRAPRLADSDGRLRWRGPARGWIEPDEVTKLLGSAAWNGEPSPLPTFEHLLLRPVRSFDPAAVAWQHAEAPSILWFPSASSALTTDDTMRFVLGPRHATAAARLEQAIATLKAALGSDDALIVDLPPGMYGISTAFFRAIQAGLDSPDSLTPVLVTTPDRGDLLASAERFARLTRDFLFTRWVLNRNRGPVERHRTDIREATDLVRPNLGIEYELQAIGWSDNGLGAMFQRASLGLPAEEIDRVLRAIGAS